MAELTQEMIEGRLQRVALGVFCPEIPGLPGIMFVKMTLAERGKSARAYASKLQELYTEGGYFSEALISTVLEKRCHEHGIDYQAIVKEYRAVLKKMFDGIPAELQGPVDQLTDEEAAHLSPEDRFARDKAFEKRGREILEATELILTDVDRKVQALYRQIEQLEQHIKANTAEHRAREYQMLTEISLCARKADEPEKQHFTSIEDIAALEDTNRPALVKLFVLWRQFKEGLLPQFFRTDSPQMP